MQKRDVKTLSFDRQLEAVSDRRLSKNAKHSDEEQNLKQSAQILTGGNRGCQSSRFTRRFGRILDLFAQSKNKIKAFTLAEVLVTLAIIGVVAALTIPTVVKNYQKKMYITGLQKSYNNLTNGFKTYMANEGVTKLADTPLWTKMTGCGVGVESILDDNNKDFKDEFFKIFNVVATYNTENVLPESKAIKYKTLNGEEVGDVNFGIFLADGSWLYFDFDKNVRGASCGERKSCTSLREFQEINNTPTKLWEYLGFVEIDINGAKGPNTMGRDVFGFVLSNDGNLYPFSGKDMAVLGSGEGGTACTYDNINSCRDYWVNNPSSYNKGGCGPSSEGVGCAAKIMEENWQMNY